MPPTYDSWKATNPADELLGPESQTVILPSIICNRIVRTIAELREFCDAAEATANTSVVLPLRKPLDIWVYETRLPDGSRHLDVAWDVASQAELDEMAEAEEVAHVD